MKKNAFTLIELLAVVTILAILSIIITPIVDKNIKKTREQIYEVQLENIRLAGQNYFSEHKELKPEENLYATIELQELINQGYIQNTIKNPKTGENFTETIYVKLTNINGKYEYKVCPLETCS